MERAPPSSAAAALDSVLGLLARQRCMKQEPSWSDLHELLDSMFQHRTALQVRRIMTDVAWFSHSTLFTGVTSIIAQGLVDRVKHASQEDAFSQVFHAILDPVLCPPCRDDTLKARRRMSSSTSSTQQRWAKRWEALVPSLRRLMHEYPVEFASCVPQLDLVSLASYQHDCVSVAVHHLLHLIPHAPASSSIIPSLVQLVLRSILHLHPVTLRDDLLHRLYTFLQDLPFQSSSCAPIALAAITACLVDHKNRSSSWEALALLVQVTCAVFQDVALDVASSWFDQFQSSSDSSDPLRLLTGFCAHTSFVDASTVSAFVTILRTHPTHDPPASLFAVLYIATHRNLPLSNCSLDMWKDQGLAQLPPALVAHVLSTYCDLSAYEVMQHMHYLGMESTTDAMWMDALVPFAAPPIHLRALELVRFHRIPPLPALRVPWTAGATPSTTPVNHHLHPDVLRHVFSFLSCKRLCRVASVCRAFYDTSLDPWLWQQLSTKLGVNTCTHPPTFVHDWKAIYQERYVHVRRLRRAGKAKTWVLCDQCSCAHISKTPLQAERHHLRAHRPKRPRKLVAGNAKDADPRRDEYSEDDEGGERSPSHLDRQKSRIGARCHTANGGARVSVRDQISDLNTKCCKHHDMLREMEERQKADKALVVRLVDELEKKVAQDLFVMQTSHDKALKAANEEIDRLSKCLNVQRGTVTTLQEQCVSLHKHLHQVEDDVQTLATEVLGD
ncbi:hypothetical protein DYB30_007379 [Aphanomyces astaci]|uniref:F-box domain-containing protein n=1 Tax=Aphanomyces astaci TaxID=112090 RepID=A0A397C0S7_APHAT|nr:hypothetical protein DYB38_006923 [Aphanomyces astaci]RHY51935.1 hypothetical protein DYB30_007379 [Aphanomyces astaci]RHZ39734.1 hypothetical protein DYB26_008856 [Aphanomyces astaci]